MIPIRTMCGPRTNVIVSGDPKQLGPIVRSRLAIGLGLDLSYLDRLMSHEVYNLETGRGITSVIRAVHSSSLIHKRLIQSCKTDTELPLA